MLLNIVWPAFLIISIFFSIISGNISDLNKSIFENTSMAVNLCVTLVGTMCLWNGIMQIASKTKMIDKITMILISLQHFHFCLIPYL